MNERDIKLAMAKLFERGFFEGDFNVIAFNALCDNFKQLGAAEERERIKVANAPEIERINAHLKSLEDTVRDEREEIIDEWWSVVQADLENGVKCLNEQAAIKWRQEYPSMATFGEWLEARGNT